MARHVPCDVARCAGFNASVCSLRLPHNGLAREARQEMLRTSRGLRRDIEAELVTGSYGHVYVGA